MLKKLFIGITTLLFVMGSYDASALPAPPFPVKRTLPDGTTITVKMTGDEFFMYTTTIDGYNVVGGEDGYYYYAENTGRELVSTGVRAHDPADRTAEERAALSRVYVGAPSWARAASVASPMRVAAADADSQELMESRRIARNSADEFKSLVILMQFRDVKFTAAADPKQAFDNLLNQEGYNLNGSTGSARDYYKYNSNEKFNPHFDVVGPFTTNGPLVDYRYDQTGAQELITEAVLAADAEVDFTQYTSDGRNADAIFVFFAGVADKSTSIWPHKYGLLQPLTCDGIRVQDYACSSEFEIADPGKISNIGAFCHEFGHVLGWPDLYDTDYEVEGQSLALAGWTLMDAGSYNNLSRTPPSFNAMEKYMQGWIELKEFDLNNEEYSMKPITEDEAYIIETDNNGEFFLIEVRSENDSRGPNVWEKGLAKHFSLDFPVLLAYHVDQSNNMAGSQTAATRWRRGNSINNYPPHECFKIVRAQTTNQYRDWCFPGPSNTTLLGSSHIGDFMAWNGSKVPVALTRITQNGNNIDFRLTAGDDVQKFLKVLKVGSDYAEFDWRSVDEEGTFVVEVFDVDGVKQQEFETTDKMAVVSNLQPSKSYKVVVTLKDSDIYDFMNFRTSSPGPESSMPYLPFSGTYPEGTPIALRIVGLTDNVDSWQWYIDGEKTDSSIIALPAGKHTISVKAVLSDGNEEIYSKTITIIKM